MWELDCKESWAPKNWCFWTVVLEKTLESPLDCKEIQLVHSKWDQSWVFFGKNDTKAETPVFWPSHAKKWLIGIDSDVGRDWGQEEKGTTEDGMAGWHLWLNGLESEWTPGVGDGQGGLACCNSWGHTESDTTEQLNWTELYWLNLLFIVPLSNSFFFLNRLSGHMEHTESSLFRYIFKKTWNSIMLKSTCFYCFIFNTIIENLKWMSKIIKMFLCFKSSKAFLWTVILLVTLGLSLPFFTIQILKIILAFIFICKLRGLVIEIIIKITNFRTSSRHF